MAMDQRPDQHSRPTQPLSPGGVSIGQMIQQGLLTNADMVALGLAKDTSVTTTLPTQIQTMGAAPYVLNLKSDSMLQQAPSGGGVFHTFGAKSRIWGAHLSLSMATSSGYTAGTTSQIYARVFASGSAMVTLTVAELSIAATSSQANTGSDADLPGLVVQSGDTVTLDVNNGSTVGNAVIRASCTFLYSTP